MFAPPVTSVSSMVKSVISLSVAAVILMVWAWTAMRSVDQILQTSSSMSSMSACPGWVRVLNVYRQVVFMCMYLCGGVVCLSHVYTIARRITARQAESGTATGTGVAHNARAYTRSHAYTGACAGGRGGGGSRART